MGPRWRTAGALAFLLALTVAFYWKITISGKWTYLEASDIAIQVRPWLDFQAREFHAGHLPLWDPYEWGGHSLIGQLQPGLANPLNWILFAMPLRDGHIPVTTLQWYWVLIHWLGAVFAYALCRDLRCGYAASVFGASVFALAGFVGHTDWPQVLFGAVWVPVVLLFFARAVRGERRWSSAALCGAALGISFLGTHPVVPTFTAILVGALWIVSRRFAHFGLFLLMWLAIASAQLLPSIEYGKEAIRWAGAPEPLHWNERVPYAVHAQYSLGWRSVAGIVVPGISLHANPHVGLVAAGLAVAAIWRRRKERTVRWMAAVAVGGLVLALGGDFPPYWLLWRFVPLAEKAREPAFAIVLCQIGIAALAGIALASFRRTWLAWIALALFLGEAFYDTASLARFDRPGSYAQMIENQRDVADFLHTQPGWFRVDFDDTAVPYNFGDLHGIEQFGAQVSSMPERIHDLLGRAETPARFGVQYHVGTTPSAPEQQEVFRSRSGLKVYRDPRIGEPFSVWRSRPCGGADRFRSISRAPDRTEFEADLSCPGLVLMGDAFYPGWRARVDGRRIPVQEAYAVRAIPIEAGHHRVELLYRPTSVYRGFCIAAGALVLLVLLWSHEARQRGANQHTGSIAD